MDAARGVQLLGGAWLAYLILKLVLDHLERQKAAATKSQDAQKRAPSNGSLGEREVKFWERLRSIVKANSEEIVCPRVERMVELEEVATARLISMDAEGRAMFEAEMKVLEEITRQEREIAEMLRRRNEADAAARSATQVGLANYARDVADLAKMVQKLIDRGGN